MTLPLAPLTVPADIPPLGPFDLYAYLGLVRVMEPHTEVLMRERAEQERVAHDYGPHERPWFVSFHGSEFPGEPMDACKRYLLYRMMDLPPSEIVPPWVTTTGKIGKAGELDLADAWYRGGRLLAVPEDPADPDTHQLGFVRPELWFTVSTDLPILPPGWTRPHIVEVKCKSDDVLDEMLQGRVIQLMDGSQQLVGRGPDASHVNQLKATIGEAHDYDWGEVVVCKHSWRILGSELHQRLGLPNGLVYGTDAHNRCPDHGYDCQHGFELEPPTSGEVYYWSRSWPRKTKSFYYEYDSRFMDAGREILAETRQHFLDDVLPERPGHFQWSSGPCKNCAFKATVCRPDAGVPGRKRKPDPKLVRSTLSGSNGVDYAQALRDDYDFNANRERVLAEWEEDAALPGSDRS